MNSVFSTLFLPWFLHNRDATAFHHTQRQMISHVEALVLRVNTDADSFSPVRYDPSPLTLVTVLRELGLFFCPEETLSLNVIENTCRELRNIC